MNLINWWSTIGLILDITGAMILFRFGLPSKMKESSDSMDWGETTEEEKQRNKLNNYIKLMSNIGLCFIVLGFIFQLIGSNPFFYTCRNHD